MAQPNSRYLDNWITNYLQYTYYSEAPEEFHFWTAVSSIAAALQRKCWLPMGHFNFSTNFFIVFVAKPGVVTKSSSIDMGRAIMSGVKSIIFGPDAITWQAIPQLLQQSAVHYQMSDGSFFPMSCLTFASSELGNLLDPKNQQFIDLLVTMWDGKDTFSKMTKMSGCENIANPWVNILAATTPDWLSDNLPKGLVGGGFISRCMFVYGRKKRHVIAYPARVMKNLNFDLQHFKDLLTHDLESISMLEGPFTMTDDAMDYGEQWYIQHCAKMELAENETSGFLARKQASVHKLAMVLSASESNSMIVEKKHLVTAIKFTEALEADYPFIFQKLHSTPESDKSDRLVTFLRQYPQGYPKRQLFQQFYNHFSNFHQFEDALNTLVQADLVRLSMNGSDVIVQLV